MARQRKISAEKSPFTLRQRKLNDGRISLFIDRRTAEGHKTEFLQLYLLPGTTTRVQRANAKTQRTAETILQERIEAWMLERNARNIPKTAKDILLSEWMEKVIDTHNRRNAKDVVGLSNTRKLLSLFNADIYLDEIDKDFLTSFIDWMRTTYKKKDGNKLINKSIDSYCISLRTALSEAVRQGLLLSNPWNRLDMADKVKVPPSKVEYLTIGELKKMMQADCPSSPTKTAYIFACFTGLRISDIRKLTWGDIHYEGEQPYLSVMMTKTDKPVFIPLSRQALRWLPERGDAPSEQEVFDHLVNTSNLCENLKKLAKNANINKHITFHTARHTFATMLLTLGADIYTVSKLLGHSSVKATQIYAKIVDKSKDDAVGLIDTAF